MGIREGRSEYTKAVFTTVSRISAVKRGKAQKIYSVNVIIIIIVF